MDATRIKIKLGQHEFEAEGPADMVQSQFAAFKELISNMQNQAPKPNGASANQEQVESEVKPSSAHIPLEKILHVNGRVVSLTALPGSTDDAALLIMLGHKDMRNHVSVTGQEIGDGLAQSGRPVLRVDRL